MDFLGRRVIPTTLDPIPDLLRAAPGCIAMTTREVEALRKGDGSEFKRLAAIAYEHDKLDARGIGVWRKWRIPRRAPRSRPTTRLSLLAAIHRGRTR